MLGNVEEREEIIVPIITIQGHQHRPAGVTGIGNMLTTGQPVDQVGFNRTEREIVARRPDFGPVLQHPADFAAREIGVKQKRRRFPVD